MGATKHGLRSHPLYRIWANMKDRCYNPNHPRYEDYGGRGILVCQRWLYVVNFINDMEETYRKGLQLDRKENDGNYSPDNCRWSTRSQNMKNRRNKASCQSSKEYVTYNKHYGKWVYSRIFNTQEDAELFAEFVEFNRQ